MTSGLHTLTILIKYFYQLGGWDLHFRSFRHLLVHPVIVYPVPEKVKTNFFGTLACHNFWTHTGWPLGWKLLEGTPHYPPSLNHYRSYSRVKLAIFVFFRFLRHFGDVTVGGRNVGSTSGSGFWVRGEVNRSTSGGVFLFWPTSGLVGYRKKKMFDFLKILVLGALWGAIFSTTGWAKRKVGVAKAR